MKGRVAVDFDGVIHHYTTWDGNPPKGKPVFGVRDGLRKLIAAGYELVVFTARDPNAVLDWLTFYELKQYFVQITNRKTPDIIAFFDDRGFNVVRNAARGLLAAVDSFLDARLDEQGTPLPLAVVTSQRRLEA